MSDQIWAVCDGSDSMPRRYALVNNVVLGNEICVTFLEPHPMLVDEIYWLKEILLFVCGLFEPGETTLNLRLSNFSHIVLCEQNKDKSLYRIFPKKGEIWAVYRNWSGGWKCIDFVRCQCQIVEIIADFSEESGLVAASL